MNTGTLSEMPDEVARAFDGYAPEVRAGLLSLRRLILETAAATKGVLELTETLKWGEPAYLTKGSKSGSTVRLGPKKKKQGEYCLFFNCNTTLVRDFRGEFGEQLTFEGDRAICFRTGEAIPKAEVRACIEQALTYHLNKG